MTSQRKIRARNLIKWIENTMVDVDVICVYFGIAKSQRPPLRKLAEEIRYGTSRQSKDKGKIYS